MSDEQAQLYFVADDAPLTQSEETQLAALEQTIERGLKTFIDVGTALIVVRDMRLYRQRYGTFEEYCQQRWGMQRRYANRLIAAAEVVENLGPIGPILPATESQARPLTKLEPDEQREVWQKAVDTAPGGKVTAAHVQSVVDEYEERVEAYNVEDEFGHVETVRVKPHVSNNSGNNEWYTPSEYIEAARRTLGNIDLDPASSDEANKIVQADTYYTIDDNGLGQTWRGRVWMNPPYASDLVGRFTEKLARHYQDRDVEAAIVLVNNATETQWFQSLAEHATAICFPSKRVRFWSPDGVLGAPLQGQALIYLGKNADDFIESFWDFGILARVA